MKHRWAKAVAAAVLLGATIVPLGSSGAGGSPGTLMGVYRSSSNTSLISSYEAWLGRPMDLAETFLAGDSWGTISNPGGLLDPWSSWVRAKAGRNMIVSVPMLPSGSPADKGTDATVSAELSQGAQGAYDAYFRQLGQTLVSKGLGNSILRIGWEFNGGWYRFRAKPNPAAWTTFFRRIVNTVRAVPGSNFTIDWNPTLNAPNGFDATTVYPGDSYVDVIGLDVYDQTWMSENGVSIYPIPSGATRAEKERRWTKVWNEQILNGTLGLSFWAGYAASHGKPLSFPEWGLSIRNDGHGGGDNYVFVRKMRQWIDAHDTMYHAYFERTASDGDHCLSQSPTPFPEAAREFVSLFSSTSPTSTTSSTAAPTASTIAPTTSTTAPAVTTTTAPATSPTTAPGGAGTTPTSGTVGVRGTSTDSDGGSRSYVSLALPPGVASGDLLVAAVSLGRTSTMTTPSGWTLLAGWPRSTGIDSWGTKQYVFHRVADGTEGATATFSKNANVGSTAVLVALTGAHRTAPFDVTGSAGLKATSASVPSLTTTVANAHLLALVSLTSGTSTLTAVSPPSSLVERVEVGRGYNTSEAASTTQANAGATGTRTFAFSNQSQAILSLLAVRPAATAPATTTTTTAAPATTTTTAAPATTTTVAPTTTTLAPTTTTTAPATTTTTEPLRRKGALKSNK